MKLLNIDNYELKVSDEAMLVKPIRVLSRIVYIDVAMVGIK